MMNGANAELMNFSASLEGFPRGNYL